MSFLLNISGWPLAYCSSQEPFLLYIKIMVHLDFDEGKLVFSKCLIFFNFYRSYNYLWIADIILFPKSPIIKYLLQYQNLFYGL